MIWGAELRHYLLVLLAAVCLLQSACSSKTRPETIPTPLQKISSAFDTKTEWKYRLPLKTGLLRGFSRRLVITDGRVYVSNDKGEIDALSPDKGRREWRNETGLMLSSGLAFGQGLVLAGGSNGEVIAIGADDGHLRWQGHVSSEVLAPPAVSDDAVVVHTIDGKLTALSIMDGRMLWTYQAQVPTLSLHGLGTPLLYQGNVIAGLADGRVVALNLNNGEQAWETTVAVPHGRSELERLVDIDADLVQYGGVLYAGAYQGRVVAVDMTSGRLLWARDMSIYRGLAVDDNGVYVVDDADGVWCLSRRNGATLWKQDGLLARAVTAPLLLGDSLVVGDVEGYIHWLKRDDGGFVARTRVAEEAVVGVQKDSDDALYVVTKNGYITKLKTAAKKVADRKP